MFAANLCGGREDGGEVSACGESVWRVRKGHCVVVQRNKLTTCKLHVLRLCNGTNKFRIVHSFEKRSVLPPVRPM